MIERMDMIELRTMDVPSLVETAITGTQEGTVSHKAALSAISEVLTEKVVGLIRLGSLAELFDASAALRRFSPHRLQELDAVAPRAGRRISELLPILNVALSPDTLGSSTLVLDALGRRAKELLGILAEAPLRPVLRAEVRDRMAIDQGNLSRLINSLEGTGLLERINFSTGVFLQLTPKGRQATGAKVPNVNDAVAIRDWLSQMIGSSYLIAIPNDLVFNPVLADREDRSVGTNISIDAAAWAADIDSGKSDAERLLNQTAAMIVDRLLGEIGDDAIELSNPRPLKSSPDDQLALSTDINNERFLELLNEACANNLKHRRPVKNSANIEPICVELVVQDSLAIPPPQESRMRVALLGFNRSDIEIQNLVHDERSQQLRELIDDRALATPRPESFKNSRIHPQPNRPVASRPITRANPSNFTAFCNVLRNITEAVKKSGSVLSGLYVQPTPTIDNHWIDVAQLSEYLASMSLTGAVWDVFDWIIDADRANCPDVAIYDVCQPSTATADRRFDLLRQWAPRLGRTIPATLQAGEWRFEEEPSSEIAYIISAVSNNWYSYQELTKSLTERHEQIRFISLLGPTTPRISDPYIEDGRTPDVDFLPALVWDIDRKCYVPGTETGRFRGTWRQLANEAEAAA